MAFCIESLLAGFCRLRGEERVGVCELLFLGVLFEPGHRVPRQIYPEIVQPERGTYVEPDVR